MPLINCKSHLELNWSKNCIASNISGNTTFKITNTKLYVPIITLSSKDNVKLAKQLNRGFERSVYWNEYKTKRESKNLMKILHEFLLILLFKELKNCLFLLLIVNNDDKKVENDSHGKYFLPRVNITDQNVLLDGRNFYDQPLNDQIKKYDEVRKIAGCLLDYKFFKKVYQLIATYLQTYDTDLKAVQQIKFYGMLKTNSQVCTVLETVLEFYKGTAKRFLSSING